MMLHSDQPQFDSATMEPTVEPIPPRYWWLKRIALAAGLLLVALFALRLWWGWEANRRLHAEIDKIIAAGEPIYPEDFDPKEDIPDEQNAARLLIGADEVINLTSQQQEILQKVTGEPDLIRARLDEVREIVEGNVEVFRRLRRARDLPRTDWGVRICTPAINTLLPSLPGQRQLSKLLSLSTSYHHAIGDDKAAVELMRDALALGNAVGQMPGWVPIYVAMATDGVVFQSIEAISSTLNIKPANSFVQLTGNPCKRDDTEALLRNLLNEQAHHEAIKHALFFERMSQLDIVRGIANRPPGTSSTWGAAPPPSSTPWPVLWGYVITPLVELDGATMIRDRHLRLQAAAESDWVRAKRALPKEPTQYDTLGRVVRFLSVTWEPSLERFFLLHFRSLTSRRLAATALAIRLYQVDKGRRPQSLAELVPEYLPETPRDPFAGDGSAIGYLPEGRPAILYSVGPDGVDDGGRYTFRSGGIDWDQLDMPFFLEGNRPTKPEDLVGGTRSSTQAGEDQKNTEENEGDADENGDGEEEP